MGTDERIAACDILLKAIADRYDGPYLEGVLIEMLHSLKSTFEGDTT